MGHSVRGTTRAAEGALQIEAAGAEAAVADPDRLGTILPLLEGVSVVCWLLGSAAGEAESVAALHGPRLRSLQEKLVDSGVRGLVYEAAGSVDPDSAGRGRGDRARGGGDLPDAGGGGRARTRPTSAHGARRCVAGWPGCSAA